jgi:AraC-like DNA-binding protein
MSPIGPIRRTALIRENDLTPGVSVATHSREYPRGSRIPVHAHGSHQLVYASRGVMEVSSGQSLWKIPPHFGLWIPARTRLPLLCTVLHIGTFFRELIVEIVRVGRLRMNNRIECALDELLIAELERASPVPTGIHFPADSRAYSVAQIVMEDPGWPISLKSMCVSAGVSVRTLERTFRREVGTDFECWRRQVRLMKAIEMLVAGCRVKEVAFAVGYQHPGAFVALFRQTFGTTPKAWMSALERFELAYTIINVPHRLCRRSRTI